MPFSSKNSLSKVIPMSRSIRKNYYFNDEYLIYNLNILILKPDKNMYIAKSTIFYICVNLYKNRALNKNSVNNYPLKFFN